MRQVIRLNTPQCLVDSAAAANDYAISGKINKKLYGGTEVIRNLRAMYLDKCFMCENYVGEHGIVEHFLPHDQSQPNRAYDWANLNWSCGPCNDRKRRKPFRVPPTGAAQRTDLIDPSAPPTGYTVEQLLAFNTYCDATIPMLAALPAEVALVAQNTKDFLNEPVVVVQRLRRFIELNNAIEMAPGTALWRSLATQPVLDPTSWSPEQEAISFPALDSADAIYAGFLTSQAPFSVCMRAAVFEKLRLSVNDFRRLSNVYRSSKNVPPVGD